VLFFMTKRVSLSMTINISQVHIYNIIQWIRSIYLQRSPFQHPPSQWNNIPTNSLTDPTNAPTLSPTLPKNLWKGNLLCKWIFRAHRSQKWTQTCQDHSLSHLRPILLTTPYHPLLSPFVSYVSPLNHNDSSVCTQTYLNGLRDVYITIPRSCCS
jgi:hypothetical protein